MGTEDNALFAVFALILFIADNNSICNDILSLFWQWRQAVFLILRFSQNFANVADAMITRQP